MKTTVSSGYLGFEGVDGPPLLRFVPSYSVSINRETKETDGVTVTQGHPSTRISQVLVTCYVTCTSSD